MLMQKANIALQNFSYWMRSNQQELVPDKSEAVLLTRKRKMRDIQLNSNNIMPKPATNYLGVCLDINLSFAAHGHQTRRKIT